MQQSNINTEINTSRINLLSKVYIWSVVMEPLYYFTLAPQNVTGVGGNFSRILQFIVITCLCLKMLAHGRVRISNPFSTLNINYTYYFIFAVFSGCYGIMSGAYSLDIVNILTAKDNPFIYDSFIASIIRNPNFRPPFEYFITLYYFVYFVVLARYLITTEKAINYFFRLFVIVLFICVFVGILDLLTQVFTEYGGISNYIYNRARFVGGLRFHGIAGEPRDAFGYLMLGLGILALRDIWKDEKKLTLFLVFFMAIIAMLTQSFSGLLGIVFFFFLLIIYYLPNVSLKAKLLSIFCALIAILMIYANFTMSGRLMSYYKYALPLYSELVNGEVNPTYHLHLNNIYPIWHLWLKIKEFEFLPFIIGNGLGSVKAVNNYYMGTSGLANTNAFIIKSIYETGVIGTLLFIAAFLSPLKKLYINHKIKDKVRLLMLLMLGVYFAHKTAIPYIFLGIALVVMKNKLITSGSTS